MIIKDLALRQREHLKLVMPTLHSRKSREVFIVTIIIVFINKLEAVTYISLYNMIREKGEMMSAWIEGLQNAIEYMEQNITEDLQVKDIAEKAYVSEYYFQRIFSVLCGFSVAEYIRNRRMALAARELVGNDEKIIDIALKYGYDSPDSFSRSFTKFHGITPSMAREKGAQIRDFAPLKIVLSLEGGTMLDYRIEEKAAFTVDSEVLEGTLGWWRKRDYSW